jgi:hypothetical protein
MHPDVMARRRVALGLLAAAVLLRAAPADATVWLLSGQSRFTASVGGASRSEKAPFQGALILADDGTYQIPGAGITCGPGGEVGVDEVGTWTAGRHGRLRLDAANVDALRRAVGQCLGFALRIRAHRRWVKVDADGQSLRGKTRWVGVAAVNGHTVAFRLVIRYQGSPALPAAGAS